MAKMIPMDITHLPVNTKRSERALYRIIEKHTPDDWICYAGHKLVTGTTPDFVLMGPELGFLILEEKSIPLNLVKSLSSERWTVIREGGPQEETHPLRQARTYAEKAAGEMKRHRRLTDDRGRLKFVFGHGVVLSSIRREEMAQGSITFSTPPIATFEPHLVIFSDELPRKGQKESDFAERLLKMTRLFRFDKLDDGDLQTIRSMVFPESRARPLVDVLLDRNSVLEALTVQQEQMARGIGKNDIVPHRLLNGVAGCGKSIILRIRTADVAAANPDWKVLLTFFTRSLKKFLSKDMPSNVDVMTIGQCLFKQWKGLGYENGGFDNLSDEGWARTVRDIKEKGLSKGVYQAVFVDECQDLTPVQVDFMRHVLSENENCAFFCGDAAQNIFSKKRIRWIDHGFKFRGRTSNATLSFNYRNTREIFEFALEFVKEQVHKNDIEGSVVGLSKNPYQHVDFERTGETPEMREFSTAGDEIRWICHEIVRLVRDEEIAPGTISIIHPNATPRFNNVIAPYIQSIENQDIPTYWISKDETSKINFELGINRVAISTPNSAKGLEWDIVFMPCIHRYYGDSQDNLRFVAATRARNLLYPSIHRED
ncbi:MAG: AAA family ATPase [Deltaproteobacteria bacterium]|nr:AAA family ATPase [Deltaproteobacteria bacterium]